MATEATRLRPSRPARALRERLGVARLEALRDAWQALWISRVVVWTAGLVALALLTLDERAPGFDPEGHTTGFGTLADDLLAPAARWDAVWFAEIAEDGYGAPADDSGRPAFFPLYPLLARLAGMLFTGNVVTGGLLVSFGCALGALYVVRRYAELELGPEAARIATWLVALFPMSFFLTAMYSESLFLLLSCGCLYAARTGRWQWAAALGVLAALTRSAGLVLVVPLLVIAWRERTTTAALAVAAVPVGLAGFCAALALDGWALTAPFDAQDVWFRELAAPFAGVWLGAEAAFDGARQLLSGSRTPVYFEDAGGDPFEVARINLTLFGFLLALVPALVGVARRMPFEHIAYCVAALALPLSYPVTPQPLMSLPRFELVLFPLFLWAGAWLADRPAAARPGAYGACTVLLCLFTAQFATWHFVA